MSIEGIPNKNGNKTYEISDFTVRRFIKKVINQVKKGELHFLHFDFLLKSLWIYPFKNQDKSDKILRWIGDCINNEKHRELEAQKSLLRNLQNLEKMIDEDYSITGQITYIDPNLMQFKNFALVPVLN